MIHKLKSQYRDLLERMGLDWFVLLAGKPAFFERPDPYPNSLKEIREKFGNLTDIKKLDDAIDFCTNLLEREDKRSEKIESKAFTLIGITGIASGFIIGFASLLLDQAKITSDLVLILASILYVLVVISLMWAIFLSIKVVTVGDYIFTYPSANDIFDLSQSTLLSVKNERVVSLFYSFVQNRRAIDRKATYLNGSQLWFRNSISLLLIITLLLAIYTPYKAFTSKTSAIITNITPTITLQPTKVKPSPTPTSPQKPTSSPTRQQPVETPTVSATAQLIISETIIP